MTTYPPPRTGRPTLRVFGWAGAGIIGIGLVVVLVLAIAGSFAGPDPGTPGPGVDLDAPPLARRCPPPTAVDSPGYAEPEPPPPGKRTVDERVGISYAAYGEPWRPWREDWSGGDLKVHYRVGQHFVTEHYVGGDYHASILSGSVPATVNDGFTLDLRCVGRQVTADVRRSYYPQPNRIRQIREEQVDLGGRPGWVSVFRLHFRRAGLKATDELVAVVLIDVGRPEAAVLYVSIPGTHARFDHVVDDVIDSVRPTD
ncbi:MAG TPA: hypothetical protein VHJ83_03400 [Micromonosporaceae bacterium]|nr:hypothetical protein [Micromonosporaceae bacterium]